MEPAESELADKPEEPVPKKLKAAVPPGVNDEKQLYQKLSEQMLFYFSDANLNKDRFLRQHIEKAVEQQNGWIDVSLFLSFNKIAALTSDAAVVCRCLLAMPVASKALEVDIGTLKLRRHEPLKPVENTDHQSVYVEFLPHNTTVEAVRTFFATFGKVSYVSLPKYEQERNRNSIACKGYAFIDYEQQKDAEEVFKQWQTAVAAATISSSEDAAKGKGPVLALKNLRMMPKTKWTALRNEYYANQQQHMKELKERLALGPSV